MWCRQNINLGTTVQKRFLSDFKKSRFLDSLRVHVRGGAGGQGNKRKGGVGGTGGDVVFVADRKTKLKDILENSKLTKRFTASTGSNSSKSRLIGQSGDNIYVKVPVGVCVKTDDGTEIADFNEDGQEFVAAAGGEGGNSGNMFQGMKGEARMLKLDLKLIADIGLVGFPNAGKSTFLKAVSRTSPKIAEYPFTTIRPQIGTMMYPDSRQITVADLPGLIEGAHVNIGMGHKFLKHVERTKLLLFMVDVHGFQLGKDYEKRTAFETILLLNKELELYNPELMKKPAVLTLNKMDLATASTEADRVEDLVKNLPDSLELVPSDLHPETVIQFDQIFRISAMLQQNTDEVKVELRRLLDRLADERNKEDWEYLKNLERLKKFKGLLAREHSDAGLS